MFEKLSFALTTAVVGLVSTVSSINAATLQTSVSVGAFATPQYQSRTITDQTSGYSDSIMSSGAFDNDSLFVYDARARADFGNIGAYADIGLQASGEAVANRNTVTAGAGWSDTLSFGVETGFYDLILNISGTESLSGNVNSVAESAVDVFAFGNGTPQIAYQSRGYLSIDPRPSQELGTLGARTLRFGFTNGQLDLDVRLGVFAACAESGGQTCSSTVDFFGSATVTGGAVFDGNGILLSGATVTSESGFNYITGSGAQPSPVPVPASLPLLAIGLGGLGFMARRKRKAA